MVIAEQKLRNINDTSNEKPTVEIDCNTDEQATPFRRPNTHIPNYMLQAQISPTDAKNSKK